MDEQALLNSIGEEFIRGWQMIPMDTGVLVVTDWRWPNGDGIEIYVRGVAERRDLYVVTDGGGLCSFLFAGGINLQEDSDALASLQEMVTAAGLTLVDYQVVRGAGNEDLPRAIRLILEAVKEGAFMFSRQISHKSSVNYSTTKENMEAI